MEPVRRRREAANAEVNSVRGNFLSAMIDLEAHIDRAIVFFFAPDELRIFIDTVLDRLTFASKVKALRKILRHVGLEDKHRDFVKEVDDLRMERNEFAHVAFELVGGLMRPGDNYELYRKERLDIGPRVEDIGHLSELKDLVCRAQVAERRAVLVEQEITRAHDQPDEYFYRRGWDPKGRFPTPKGPEAQE